MICRCTIAALLTLTATIASAQDGSEWPHKRMSLLPGEGDCFALIEVENLRGYYRDVEVLQTKHGPVSVRYDTIGGHNATDHDLVDVMDLPYGVAANPMHIELPDGSTAHICLMEYLGN